MKNKFTSHNFTTGELEHLLRLFDNIPAEIGVLDLQRRFLFNTPYGIRDSSMRQWVIGKTHHEYCRKRGFPKSFADIRQRNLDECIKKRKTVTYEEPITDKSGNLRYYLRMFSPVFDAEGLVSHIIGHGQEISELKKTEEALRNALAEVEQLKNKLLDENIYLREEIKIVHNFEEIISTSKKFKNVLRNVEQVAHTNATTLILGETGTGKELLARAAHNISGRKDRPLVKVDCTALPANLIESELFGHEKGAFTGAFSRKVGRFELADGGTIFLDEIGDMPIESQAKLLRVLQEGTFERLGNPYPIKIDVRVIAATNRDLEKAVENGEFRKDLYFRLNVFPIKSLPLRGRKEDIPILVEHFCDKYGVKIGKKIEPISQKVMDALCAYDWPGDIRELENIIERAIILNQGSILKYGNWLPVNKKASISTGLQTLEENEKKHIRQALELTGWRVSGKNGTAKLLGINASTLDSRIRKLGIERQV